MNRLALYALAGSTLLASGVQAQTINTPLTSSAQTVPGMANSNTGSPGATEVGDFQTWAYINSVLQFSVTDSTLDCGIVTGGNSSNVGCVPTNTNAPNSTATLTVQANAPWSLSINDGFTYNADPAEKNRSTMTVDVPYDGTFVLKLAAANVDNGNSDPTAAPAEPPFPGATVNISASYDQSVATADDPEKVDYYDNFGNYFGFFTVVLFEE